MSNRTHSIFCGLGGRYLVIKDTTESDFYLDLGINIDIDFDSANIVITDSEDVEYTMILTKPQFLSTTGSNGLTILPEYFTPTLTKFTDGRYTIQLNVTFTAVEYRD